MHLPVVTQETCISVADRFDGGVSMENVLAEVTSENPLITNTLVVLAEQNPKPSRQDLVNAGLMVYQLLKTQAAIDAEKKG